MLTSTATLERVAAHVSGRSSKTTSEIRRACSAEKSLCKTETRNGYLLFSHYPPILGPNDRSIGSSGVNIDLICLRDGGEPAHELVRINVTRVPVKRQRGGRLGYLGQYAAFLLTSFFYLASRSLRPRYDLVHVHNMPDVLVFSATVPKLLGAKVILDLHDPMPELMQTIFRLPENSLSVVALKRLEQWSIRFADLVLTVNLACKKIYSSRSCQPHKIRVVINSPDDEIFRLRRGGVCNVNCKNGNSSKPFGILYHGSLVHRNGFDLAVESLEKVGEQFHLCG
jgi:glycosyltransferase involved in cell wall biosynthesis